MCGARLSIRRQVGAWSCRGQPCWRYLAALTEPPAMTGEHAELAARLEALPAAATRGDWDAVFAFAAADCVLIDDNVRYRGREAIISHFERAFEPEENELRVERTEVEVAPDGEHAVVATNLVVRGRGNDYPLVFRQPSYFGIELRDRKLWEIKLYDHRVDARAAAGLGELPRWRDRKKEDIVSGASTVAFMVRANAVDWYAAHEVAVIGGVAILLTVSWVLFYALPRARHPVAWYSIVVAVVVVLGGILALIAAVVLRTSTWRLFYWLAVLLLLFLLMFAEIYWSIGTQSNFDGAAKQGLRPLDATYFALGTVSTAGTGNMYAKSELARGMQLAQIGLGMAVILVVVSAVVARLTSDKSHDARSEG